MLFWCSTFCWITIPRPRTVGAIMWNTPQKKLWTVSHFNHECHYLFSQTDFECYYGDFFLILVKPIRFHLKISFCLYMHSEFTFMKYRSTFDGNIIYCVRLCHNLLSDFNINVCNELKNGHVKIIIWLLKVSFAVEKCFADFLFLFF